MLQDDDGGPVADEARVMGWEGIKVWPVTLSFYALRANEQAQVRLNENSASYWGDPFPGSSRVGIAIAASPPDALLCAGRFIMNKKVLFISNGRDCVEMRVRLYVHGSSERIDGVVNLPPGARMEIESLVDRAVGAQGSFGLNLF